MRRYKILSFLMAACVILGSAADILAAEGTQVYNDSFESGMTAVFTDSTGTNKIIDTDGGKAYSVAAPAVMSRTEKLRNFELAFDAKIAFSPEDIAAPAVEFRKTDTGSYRLSFNTPASLLTLERIRNGISTPLASAELDIDANTDVWNRVSVLAVDDKITITYGEDSPLIDITDAFPIGIGGIGFLPGSGSFMVDNISLIRLGGGINTAEQGTAAVNNIQTTQEVEGDIIYQNDFNSGSKGTMRSDNKSELVENDSGYAYKVRGYDYEELSFGWTDFSMECDIKADFKPFGGTWPAIHMRRASNGYRYDIYFESGGGTVCIERNQSGQKTFIGNGGAQFTAKNGEWAHIKVSAVGNRIRFYYEDMNTPVFDVTDSDPILMGGIGFANGGSPEFLVDNIVVRAITVIEPETEESYDDTAKTDYDSSAYRDDIELLMGLGILPEYDETSGFRPGELITRAEFAKTLYRLIDGLPESGAQGVFSDVDESVDGYNEINILAKYGYIAGSGADTFSPEETVTAVQAAKLLLSAMGYDAMAERKGGYPTGYYNLAKTSGLLNKLDVYSDEELSRELMAKMISNALEIPFYTLSANGTTYEIDEEITFLSRRDIVKQKGMVTANFIGGIYGYSTYDEDETEFGGRIIKNGSTNIGTELGRYLIAYLYEDEDNDEYTAVYYRIDPSKKESIKVSADDIDVKTTLTQFVYNEGENTKKIPLKKNITILKNGAAAPYDRASLMPDNGWVTLLSTDNSSYDLVIVESYDTFVVGNFSSYESILYDKFDSGHTLELKEAVCKVYRGGEAAELGDIKAGDVLSYAYTSKENGDVYCVIYATDRKVNGVVSERFEDEGKNYYKIGDNVYKTSEFYDTIVINGKVDAPELNMSITFCLDRFGKIAYSKGMANGFALVNRTYYDIDRDSYCAQLFTQEGNWEDLPFAAKWKYNGDIVERDAQNTVLEQLAQNQLALIRIRAGREIYSIETEQPTEITGAGVVFNRSFENVEFFGSTASFNNQSFVDQSTVVFVIPHDVYEKESYYVRGMGYLSDGKSYYAKTYNQNKYEVAQVVIVDESRQQYTNPGKLDRPFVFDHLSYSITSDNEEIALLHGYADGEAVIYRTKEIELFKGNGNDAKRIRRGDAMRLVFDDKGMVVRYVDGYWNASMSIFRVSGGRQYMFNTSLYTATDMTCVRADVVDYDAAEKRILLSGGDASTKKAYYMPSEGTVYVYDKDADELRLGSRADIAPGDFIIMEYSWNQMRDLLIYKNLD